VRNAYEFRLILEKEALLRFIATVSDEEIAAIEKQHRQIVDQIAHGEVSQAVADSAQAMDWSFHEAIIAAMRNEIVSNAYRVNSIKIRLTYQGRLRLTAHNLNRVMAEHLAIIEGIARRDMPA